MEKLYKVTEVAKLLSVNRQTIYRWIVDGKLNTVDVNGIKRIPESEIKKIIKK